MSLRPLPALGRILVALAIFLLLPTTNVLLLTSPAYIAYEYRQPRLPPAERYDAQTRLQLSQDTVRWLNSGQGIEGLAALRHEGEPVYNERELQHMADVKVVMDGLRWVWRLAALGALGALVGAILRPAWRRPCARSAFLGSAALMAVLAGILIGALLSFDSYFVQFHQVFFEAGTWTFNYEDSLIQFYPLQFWMDTTWILSGATLVEGLLVGGISCLYLARSQRPQGSRLSAI